MMKIPIGTIDTNLIQTAIKTVVILIFIIGSLIGIWKIIEYLDQPLTQARQSFPLDGKQPNVLITSDLMLNDGPIIYGVIRPNEATTSAALLWRRVGETSIDLKPYLNKQVYIIGEWYLGYPQLLKTLKQDIYGLKQKQPVMRIKQIRSVLE